jgi:hypothetical protein
MREFLTAETVNRLLNPDKTVSSSKLDTAIIEINKMIADGLVDNPEYPWVRRVHQLLVNLRVAVATEGSIPPTSTPAGSASSADDTDAPHKPPAGMVFFVYDLFIDKEDVDVAQTKFQHQYPHITSAQVEKLRQYAIYTANQLEAEADAYPDDDMKSSSTKLKNVLTEIDGWTDWSLTAKAYQYARCIAFAMHKAPQLVDLQRPKNSPTKSHQSTSTPSDAEAYRNEKLNNLTAPIKANGAYSAELGIAFPLRAKRRAVRHDLIQALESLDVEKLDIVIEKMHKATENSSNEKKAAVQSLADKLSRDLAKTRRQVFPTPATPPKPPVSTPVR